MYLNHFGLNEPPFRITPHTDFFFGGAKRGATLEALLYAISHDEGIVKVSGEVGSGKTMLCRVLMERLPEQVQTILLANPSLSRDEILYAIAEELDIKPRSERLSVLLLKLQEHLINLYGENQRVVLLIDEAHAMSQETLEQVRLLSNLESSRAKLLQIVLFGQPELDQHLNLPHMRPLKERITHSFRLEPMLRADIEAYLDFRMRAAGYRGPNVFGDAAVREIVKASEGLTRRVNILADKSLLAAFAANDHGISAKHVKRAVRDSEFHRPSMSWAKIGLATAGVAVGLALGLGLHYLLSPSASAPVQAGASSASRAQPAAPAPPPAVAESPGTLAAPAPQASAAAAGVAATTLAPAATAVPIVPAAPQSVPEPATAKAAATPALTSATAPVAPSVPAPTQPVPSAAKAATAPAAASKAAPGAPAAAALARPIAAAPALAPARDPADGAQPGMINYVPPMPAAGKLTRERFAATQEWLKRAPGDHYSIQLLATGMRDLRRMEEMLARAPGRNLDLSGFYVYGVKIDEQQHYRLAYGLYASAADAKEGIRNLPAVYRQFGPFFRSVERMRSQNRQ